MGLRSSLSETQREHVVKRFEQGRGTKPKALTEEDKLRRESDQLHAEIAYLEITDEGFQYQHSTRRTLIHENGGVQSISRKANCYDNAVMKNFFGHLRTEMYHGEVFNTVEEFTQVIEDYIQRYNTERNQQ